MVTSTRRRLLIQVDCYAQKVTNEIVRRPRTRAVGVQKMSEGGIPLANPMPPIVRSNGSMPDHPETIRPTDSKALRYGAE